MKRILTIMAAALRLAAQGAGENYIKSVTYTDSAGTSAITRVVHFDGLGRWHTMWR